MKIDLYDTYIPVGPSRVENIMKDGKQPSIKIPSIVVKNAWNDKKVIFIKTQYTGKRAGKPRYNQIPFYRTSIKIETIPGLDASDIKWLKSHYQKTNDSEPEVTTNTQTSTPKEEEIIPALMNKTNAPKSALENINSISSVDMDVSDTRKMLETIHTSEKFKPSFLKMSDLKWKLLVRTVLRGKNIMLTGPSGEGKTLAVHAIKASLGRPFFYINLGNMQDPQTALIGKTHFKEGEGTHFEESYFIKALKTPNAIILLDEFSRLNDDAENILMSVLDYNQRYIRLTEAVDSETVNVAEGVCFIATANIGNEFTSTKVLDRAMLDRFTRIEIDALDKAQRFQLMKELYPNIPTRKLQNIADLAEKISIDYYSDAPKVETLLSTRMCVETADLLNDGFLLSEAVEVTVYPFFSTDGGAQSGRTYVKMIVQGYGAETRGTFGQPEPENNSPLFGADDFDLVK